MKILYKKEKGVSPVIATILMVAITVVLASAVYLIVSGYLTGTPAKPIMVGGTISQGSNYTLITITSVSGGTISMSSTTPLTITVVVNGTTYTNSFTPSPSNPTNFNGPTNSKDTVTGTLTLTNSPYLSAGDTITLTYNPATGSAQALPSGSTISLSYNGNTVYSATVP